MRITEIEINNFRAFYGKHTISLDNKGKNLMVFGENGSGKSSFYLALKTFFEASQNPVDFVSYENIFIPASQKNSCHLQFKIKESETSSATTTIKIDVQNNSIQGRERILVADANKIKGFFDYKSLLKTHLIHNDDVNIFHILINDILCEQINRISSQTFLQQWRRIHYLCYELKQGIHVRNEIGLLLNSFNDGLKAKLIEIQTDVNIFIQKFGYDIEVELDFEGVEYVGRRILQKELVKLKIKFFSKDIPLHQHFLNEAKLSALAISLYLAAIKSNPSTGVLKTVVLDDLLIGLDMSNRLPLLEILKDYFQQDFQIILTTYDRVWYEIVKSYFGDSEWQYVDIYSKKLTDSDFEMPIVRQNNDYIHQAQEYLNQRDYKASAVYIRSEFERLIKDFCESKALLVKYNSKQKKLTSEDFWIAIKNQTNIDSALIQEVEMCRGTVMNPFSHHDLTQPQFLVELQNSIDVVKKLKTPSFNKDASKTFERLISKIQNLEQEISQKETTIQQMQTQLRNRATQNP
ncbi:hypothetical protein VSP20_11245 [Myroides phaeus]|uniref:AAA family ATPase n=1 Tax=Myroides phaeus TaxID=702745 RepID=UPI002DBCD3FD|nr:hypothetical protein [Myroides phaeus]MEC4117547.1 hypothetical protein [Myroides phaeus]